MNWTEELHLYIDGELSAAEAARLMVRLEEDEALRAEYENLKAVVGALKGLPDEDLPPGLHAKMMRGANALARKRRINRFVRPLGAVAAAALLVFVLFTFDGGRNIPLSSEAPEYAEIVAGAPFDIDAPAAALPVMPPLAFAEEADAVLDVAEPRIMAENIAPGVMAAGGAPWSAEFDLARILAYLEALDVTVEEIIYDEDGVRIIIFIEN